MILAADVGTIVNPSRTRANWRVASPSGGAALFEDLASRVGASRR